MKYLNTYRGIIIQNNDPKDIGRVKVFVPHVNMTLYEGWNKDLEANKTFNTIGSNFGSAITPDIKRRLQESLPWGEVVQPIIGGGGSGYHKGSDDTVTTQEGTFPNPPAGSAPPPTSVPPQPAGSEPPAPAPAPVVGNTPGTPETEGLDPRIVNGTSFGEPVDDTIHTTSFYKGEVNLRTGASTSDPNTDKFNASTGHGELLNIDGTPRVASATKAGTIGIDPIRAADANDVRLGYAKKKGEIIGLYRYGTIFVVPKGNTGGKTNVKRIDYTGKRSYASLNRQEKQAIFDQAGTLITPTTRVYVANETGGDVKNRRSSRIAGSNLPVGDLFRPQNTWNTGLDVGESPTSTTVKRSPSSLQVNSTKFGELVVPEQGEGVPLGGSLFPSTGETRPPRTDDIAVTTGEDFDDPANAVQQQGEFGESDFATTPEAIKNLPEGDLEIAGGDGPPQGTPMNNPCPDDPECLPGGGAEVADGATNADQTGPPAGDGHNGKNIQKGDFQDSASQSMRMSGKPNGAISVPEPGTHVWVCFEGGDPQYPIVTGYIVSREAQLNLHDFERAIDTANTG